MARCGKAVKVAAAFILATAIAGGTYAQSRAPAERRFDYWQPDWMVRELWGPGRMPKGMMVRMLRHTIFMEYGVPKEYAEAKSMLSPDTEVVTAGAGLYAKQCASCHGSDGLGGGDASLAVTPSPALLAYMVRRPIAVDEYLLWSISDGGKQFDSEMPAFKDKLSREDIWRIVTFMRAGFPGATGAERQ